VQPVGFAADEALLPETQRNFSGHRLLQELSALPQRLLFFEVSDLAARLATVEGDEAELLVFFTRGEAALETLIDPASLSLYCTPAINLFSKRLDRIQLGPGQWEYHVVADRTRPMDYEVHSVTTVVGHGTGKVGQQDFLPLYTADHDTPEQAPGYFTARREPRLLSPKQKQQGPRSSYIGEEVFLSLVDPRHVPYREDVRQLSVTARVTNRDLPALLPQGVASGEASGWQLDAPGPVMRVDALRGPSRPVTRRPVGELGWSLVSHLSLNHQSLVDQTPQAAAAALRKLLKLYGPPDDGAWARQVDGVHGVTARTVVRRLPFKGPLAFGSGVEIVLELDEMAYQGTSAFMFASVIEVLMARHAAINTFTQLSLRTAQRGLVMRWPPRVGARDLV
jgi:type VI secretion system protein ImpG